MKIRQDSGFTLVEIMVALVILGGLSLLTTQAIKNGSNSREKFNREVSADAEVRDTLRVMERDINLAFHHRDIFTEMLNQIDRERAQAGQAGQPGAGVSTALDPTAQTASGIQTAQRKTPKNPTFFVGDAQSLNFTSVSNVRMQRDIQESEQAEIGYSLKSCKSRGGGKPGGRQASATSQCLVRRLSPIIDNNFTAGGNEVILLEHVLEFKLRYFGPKRDDWVETWQNGEGSNSDAISKENFPYAVEISLTVHDTTNPKAKKISMMLVAPVRFPNNPPVKKDQNAPGT